MLELKMATNMFGKIDQDVQKRILKFFKEPNFDTWDDISSIIIFWGKGTLNTVWQFVLKVDPTFCKHGRYEDIKGEVINEWDKIPSIKTVKKAIIFATH